MAWPPCFGSRHPPVQGAGEIYGARAESIVILLLISVSFNLFLTPGTPIFKIGFLQMTWEGLEFAAFMAVRLIFLVLGSTILTLTTTPNQLTDGLEKAWALWERSESRSMKCP